jgi:hypothetical protein
MLTTKQFLISFKVPFAGHEAFVKIASFTLMTEATVSLKRRCVSTRLYDASGQKTAIFYLFYAYYRWKKCESVVV